DLKDMELVLQDFPILDRGQLELPGEAKSTITRDSVLAAMAKRIGSRSTVWLRRAVEARALGAIAYVPSELALGEEKFESVEGKSYG
ncbi:restriction endonuclease, partial [Vibrio anguillarum]|nr:restriction endonuclease [Vibrio anguillarum]